ncbi:MAG: hypothetical protein Kow00114_02810 [Kiloniellaceae bacterium]
MILPIFIRSAFHIRGQNSTPICPPRGSIFHADSQILIRRAKNEPEGEGRLAWLAPATRRAKKAHLKTAKTRERGLFRSVIAGREIGDSVRAVHAGLRRRGRV